MKKNKLKRIYIKSCLRAQEPMQCSINGIVSAENIELVNYKTISVYI